MTGKEKIEKCRKIVSNKQYDEIDGDTMDLFTASSVVQVYDALNDENKAKLERMAEESLPRMVQAVWAVIDRSKTKATG